MEGTTRVLDAIERRPRGRPPVYDARHGPRMFGVHINMSQEIWEAVERYAEALDEFSLSWVVRTLLRERLTQLGYLKNGESTRS